MSVILTLGRYLFDDRVGSFRWIIAGELLVEIENFTSRCICRLKVFRCFIQEKKKKKGETDRKKERGNRTCWNHVLQHIT